MIVKVTGLGVLATKIGRNREVEILEDTTIFMLKEKLGLPVNAPISCVINGKAEQQDIILQEADDVKLMNLFSGG